jgi:surface antigen
MTKHLGRLAKSMLAIVFALVLAVGGLSIAVSATVVDEEFTVIPTQGLIIRTETNPNNNNNRVGALARNSVVRVDRRQVANGFEWARISHVISRSPGSEGTNAQMVGRWMAVRNTSTGALLANRTAVHGIIQSPSIHPATGTPQTRFYFTAQTTHPVPSNHRVYLSIVSQNWGPWRMNGSNNNRTWTQDLHPFPAGTYTARVTIIDANGREFTSANIGTFHVNNNAQQPPPANNTIRAGVRGDNYPYRNGNPNRADRWAFFQRECTSFVAWRLNDVNGVAFHNHNFRGNGSTGGGGGRFGNASNWANRARAIGLTVNNNPTVGAVAHWNSGHVAWVAEVRSNGDTIVIEEYNWQINGVGRHAYRTRTINRGTAQWPNNFIHFPNRPTGR